MAAKRKYDAIIIGGSYAGLSAAMALGRSLMQTLIIDSGKPCNQQAPRVHNFITHDGEKPCDISSQAKAEVLKYKSIRFLTATAIAATKKKDLFEVRTDEGSAYIAKKIILTTGLKDILPDIKGFAECWGITILHCPYCHGFEARQEVTGILANGNTAFEFVKYISNWTNRLLIFTNGAAKFTEEQLQKFKKYKIDIIESEIQEIKYTSGAIENIICAGGNKYFVEALYTRPECEQRSELPLQLGCTINEHGLLEVDQFQKTNIDGVYAAGDNSTAGRSISMAVARGGVAGMFASKELIEEGF